MKRKRASKPGRSRASGGKPDQAGKDRSPRPTRLVGLGALLCLGVAALCSVRWNAEWQSDREKAAGNRPDRSSPGELPLDAAAVLRLPSAPPQTVQGFKEEATAVGRLLVESLPDRPEAHALTALTHLQFGRKQEALASWENALARDDMFSPAHLGIGLILAESGKDERAIGPLLKAIELEPEQEQAYAHLTEVLLRRGEAEKALKIAREAVRRFPQVCEAQFWLGQAHLQRGDYEEARRCHEEAVRINPHWTASYFSLTVACARLGQRDEAAGYRERFAALKSADSQADRSRTREYDDLATQRQTALDGHLSAGRVQLRFGDPHMAEAHWLRAGVIAPEDVTSREALVSLYEQQIRPAAAIQVLDELIRLEPGNPARPLRKGRWLIEIESWPQAEQALQRVIEMQPDSAEAHFLLAGIYVRSGADLAAAELHAERSVSLAASPGSLLLLAAVREGQGDRRGALSELERALALEPGNPELRQAYGELLARD